MGNRRSAAENKRHTVDIRGVEIGGKMQRDRDDCVIVYVSGSSKGDHVHVDENECVCVSDTNNDNCRIMDKEERATGMSKRHMTDDDECVCMSNSNIKRPRVDSKGVYDVSNKHRRVGNESAITDQKQECGMGIIDVSSSPNGIIDLSTSSNGKGKASSFSSGKEKACLSSFSTIDISCASPNVISISSSSNGMNNVSLSNGMNNVSLSNGMNNVSLSNGIIDVSSSSGGKNKVSTSFNGNNISSSSKGIIDISSPSNGVIKVASSSNGVINVASSSNGVIDVASSSNGVINVASSSNGVIDVASSSNGKGRTLAGSSSHISQAAAQSDMTVCVACMDEIVPCYMARIPGCNHKDTCRICILSMLSGGIEHVPNKPRRFSHVMKCPHAGCKHVLTAEDIRYIMQDEEDVVDIAKSYADVHLKYMIETGLLANMVTCPTPDCGMQYQIDTGQTWRLACGKCKQTLCLRCRNAYHYHDTQCDEAATLAAKWHTWTVQGGADAYYKQKAVAEEYAREHGARDEEILRRYQEKMLDERRKEEECRHCPLCQRLIDKLSGCDLVKCGQDYHGGNNQHGCGGMFMWSLAKKYKSNEPSQEQLQAIAAAPPPKACSAVHHVYCSSCVAQGGSPLDRINGLRFECIHCESYNLCEKCERRGGHEKGHVFKIHDSSNFQSNEWSNQWSNGWLNDWSDADIQTLLYQFQFGSRD